MVRAYVENGKIGKVIKYAGDRAYEADGIFRQPEPFMVNDVNHSVLFFTIMTPEQRKEYGVVDVESDEYPVDPDGTVSSVFEVQGSRVFEHFTVTPNPS